MKSEKEIMDRISLLKKQEEECIKKEWVDEDDNLYLNYLIHKANMLQNERLILEWVLS